LGVALRGFSPDVQYCGAFYGQSDKGDPYPEAISVEALLRILETLPPGLTELCCHPGDGTDVDSIYRLERSAECEILCDARIRDTLAKKGIRLCSFADRSYGETATR
jgi:predicted glycoside hydrolase/deacetylase ChbG (UPF0249 family)